MLYLDTDVEGKRMTFGQAVKTLKKQGFVLGGNWEYDWGIFDNAMHRKVVKLSIRVCLLKC